MKNHNVIILKSDPNQAHPNKSTLKLSIDTLVVKPGDTVTWEIADASIASILIADDTHLDVFNPDPAPVKGSTHWKGTINQNIKESCSEEYSIYWSQDGVVYSFDPKIQVDPKL